MNDIDNYEYPDNIESSFYANPDISEVIDPPKKKNKTYTAKVIMPTKRGKVGIDFKGKGVMVETSEAYAKGDDVLVEYHGRIGEADFVILAIV